MKKPEVPDILNQIVDKVLAYRPKPKSKAARKRKRLKTKIEKERSPPENGGFSYSADILPLRRESAIASKKFSCSKGDCKAWMRLGLWVRKFGGDARRLGRLLKHRSVIHKYPVIIICAEHEQWMKRALASL